MEYQEINRYDLLVRVAEMYYMEQKTQQEIADSIMVSRSNISKMLKKCIQLGIVEFKINNLSSSGIGLQSKLKKKFKLKEVIIVPGTGYPEEVKSRIGAAAAEYLEGILANGMLVGLAWGSTLYQVVKQFHTSHVYDVDVIQLVGGMGSRSIELDGQDIIKSLQKHFHGTSYVLQAPMIVRNPILKQLLLEELEIKKHFDKFRQTDVALMGLGSNRSQISALYRSGHIKKRDADNMIKQGAIGDTCGMQFDINGNLCNTVLTGRVIGIDMPTLLKIPTRIGVASGVERAEATLGALRGNYVNVLVTDETTAKKVYDESCEKA